MPKLNIPLKRSEREPFRTKKEVNKRIIRWFLGIVATGLLAELIYHL